MRQDLFISDCELNCSILTVGMIVSSLWTGWNPLHVFQTTSDRLKPLSSVVPFQVFHTTPDGAEPPCPQNISILMTCAGYTSVLRCPDGRDGVVGLGVNKHRSIYVHSEVGKEVRAAWYRCRGWSGGVVVISWAAVYPTIMSAVVEGLSQIDRQLPLQGNSMIFRSQANGPQQPEPSRTRRADSLQMSTSWLQQFWSQIHSSI